MAWSERQRAMLAEMGIRLWSPASVPAAPRVTVASPVAKAAPAVTVVHAAPEPVAPPPGTARAALPAQRAPVRMVNVVDAVTASLSSQQSSPPQQQAPGIETMDWETLRRAVDACRACALCKSRQHAVFGVGHPQAQVMVVGEAPGEQEDRLGEPFVGKSGKLLDNMLAAIGLTRADGDEADATRQVFIANVLKCRPPMNRNPVPEEVVKCEPFLLRQVQLVKPRLILALGRFAIESLLKTQEPVGKLRGRVHRYADVPVVVSYHPAYLLRQPQEKAKTWEDLCLVLDVLRDASTQCELR